MISSELLEQLKELAACMAAVENLANAVLKALELSWLDAHARSLEISFK